MLTPSTIETIKKELQLVQAHKEGMERSIDKIMGILSQNQEPKKSGLGERAIADREARILKKTA